MEKISSYLGFVVKAKKFVGGQTFLRYYKQPLFLIMVCKTASENLKNLAKNLSNKYKCDVVESIENLESITHIKGIKIIGITDKGLSEAILNCYKEK